MMITGIHHVAITVKPNTYEKVVKFYKELLGLEEVRSWGSGESRAVMISTGDNSVLEIMSNPTAEDVSAEGSLRHIALSCDDPDGYAELLKRSGYEITIEPKEVTLNLSDGQPYRVRICFAKGAAGEIVEFFKEET